MNDLDPAFLRALYAMPNEALRMVIAHAAGIHGHRDGDSGAAIGRVFSRIRDELKRGIRRGTVPPDAPPRKRGGWDDAELQRLANLVDSGLSAREAGKVMGRSKEAMIGMAWRYGWSFGKARTVNLEPPFKMVRSEANPNRQVRPIGLPTFINSSVSLDPDTIGELKAFAASRGISRSEATRLLIEWGLETASEERGAA